MRTACWPRQVREGRGVLLRLKEAWGRGYCIGHHGSCWRAVCPNAVTCSSDEYGSRPVGVTVGHPTAQPPGLGAHLHRSPGCTSVAAARRMPPRLAGACSCCLGCCCCCACQLASSPLSRLSKRLQGGRRHTWCQHVHKACSLGAHACGQQHCVPVCWVWRMQWVASSK